MNSLQLFRVLILGISFTASSLVAHTWDFRDVSLGASLAYEGKTSNDAKFEGTKLFIDGQYVFKSKAGETSDRRQCCAMPSRPEYFYGLLDAQLRWGFDGTGLERVYLDFTPWAILWEPSIENSNNLRATSDLLQLGAVRYIADDPLEVDYYLELSLFRAGRTGIYSWSKASPFAITGGVEASTGWAWAESQDSTYSTVSNPFAGIFFTLALEHDKWGNIYMNNEFVNGFSFSNPSRGHPTVREAHVKFGYITQMFRDITLDIFFEKKSFYFDEGGLPGLYRMSRAGGIELSYHWY